MLKEKIFNELYKIKKENRFRSLKTMNSNLINLSSNDYLGIGNDKVLLQKFFRIYDNLPLSSSSSRLISGSYPIVLELEEELEKIYNKPAIVFNSGFDCNSCIIETFCDKNTLILSDRLNHSSIYDGILGSGAKFFRYNHLDLNHLKSFLLKYSNKYDNILVITETIFSMDGDFVNLDKLIQLKKEFNFYLMIDEAHSYGVYNYGMVHNKNLVKEVDFLVLPLGKGGGSNGSYLICEEIFKDYIINKGKKFIYTTALPPINNAWNLFILKNMHSFSDKREKLKELTILAHSLIKKYGLKTDSTTHIISIIIGDNEKLDKIISYLITKGYFVCGIKEPTVPKNTSRIRIGLSPTISVLDLKNFFKELDYAINSIF